MEVIHRQRTLNHTYRYWLVNQSPSQLDCLQCSDITQVKLCKGFLDSTTYTAEPEQHASQSRKWQLIGKRQWCCGAMRTIYCPC